MKAGKGLLVAQFAALHAAKQILRGSGAPPKGFPVGDVLFDLAKLQTKILCDLAEFGTAQTGTVLTYLQRRRAAAEGAAKKRPVQALVCATMTRGQSTRASFKIQNDADHRRSYALPEVLELHPAGDRTKGSIFIQVHPQPAKVDVQCKRTSAVTLTFAPSDHLDPGRYQARLPLEAHGEAHPSVELIVELVVKEPAPVKPPSELGTSAPCAQETSTRGAAR
ncbi:hypothetical protein WME76_12345 [Sorangium sp. So ce119]|uniref:hypothetical protein n=1 Tax=Sorangium sp. So ce119 TaxID=3133279 RepID=UPI003F62CDD5